MSLADVLSEPPPPIPTHTCTFCDALAVMEERDRDAVIEAAYGTKWSDRQLHDRLVEAGFDSVKKSSIGNHRQNDHSGVRT